MDFSKKTLVELREIAKEKGLTPVIVSYAKEV